MKRHFQLPHITGAGEPLDFTWDDETGSITGPGADLVNERCTFAKEHGGYWPPGAPGFVIDDPFHNMGELAAVLESFVLTDELQTALAKVPLIKDVPIEITDLDGKPAELIVTD